ncbi:MAG: acetate kinase [Nanoarchaeota archaeon]
MAKRYLIVNIGSTSKRYSLYLGEDEILRVKFEIGEKNFRDSVKIIKEKAGKIDGIGVRVVAPGEYFQKNRILNKEYMNKLRDAENISPLHVELILEELRDIEKNFRGTKIACISDSAFQASMEEKVKIYGINCKDAKELEICRYGYHGISIKSVLKKVNWKNRKIIVCHLGGGSSITAVSNGKSIDTSMGFTPLEGLPGSTRSGDIDFSAVKRIAKNKKMNFEQVENYLNFKSGFMGLAGEWDFREIIKKAEEGDEKARLTIDHFAYRIKKYIGSYYAVMNGLDVLIFTGAIGFGSVLARRKICENLENLGIEIDEKKNREMAEKEGFIEGPKSDVKIAVLESDETKQILEELKNSIKI